MMIKTDESSRIIGKVKFGEGSYVAQGSILRSISNSLQIGYSTMVLENSVLIGMPKKPLKIGSKTVFGHKCIAIGADIGNLCEIGNGVIILPGAKIGNMCIFGEGTIIPEDVVIPDESVVVGRPGKVIRKLTKNDKNMILRMRNNDITLDGDKMGKLYEFSSKYPEVSESAYVFDSAEITGDVIVKEGSTIASGVRIIGNSHGPVRIGKNVQILENSVLHLLPDNELIIEDNVIIGPGCIIHGTTIGAGSIIESGAIVCDYSKLGKNTLVKSGTLVKQRSIFEDNKILEGFPAKVIGTNDEKLKKPEWSI